MKSEKKSAIIMGIIIVGLVIGVSTSLSYVESESSSQVQTDTGNIDSMMEKDKPKVSSIDKSRFKNAPKLLGISGYINTTPEELQKMIDGKVVLYDIWTYSCINCIRTLPYITAWDETYADQGLLIIGIHSPEFEFEKEFDNVAQAVQKYGINYPVVLDNDKKIWKAFENRYWPRKYIADHEGFIRYDHIGEGAYQETERVIKELLEERAQFLGLNVASTESYVQIDEFEHSAFRTPELYFGYEFATGRNQLGSKEGFNPGNVVEYNFPVGNIQQNYFYMDGTWENLKGSMKLKSDDGSIILSYRAKEVNIVTANEADLQILIDGEIIDPSISGKDVGTQGRIHVHDDGLYNIVNSNQSEQHLLQILVNDPGFEIYTFTFG